MRKVELSKVEFEQAVWPAVHKLPAKDVQEITAIAAISRNLKALGAPRPLSEQEQALEASGEVVFPDYKVPGPVTLVLEDEEWRVLKDRLQKWLPQMTGYAAELYLDLLNRVGDAPAVKPVAAAE